MAELVWHEGHEEHRIPVASERELDDIVDRLTQQAVSTQPFVVELFHGSGASLSLGVGRPECVLDYVPASLDPPYYQSRGDYQRAKKSPLAFQVHGEWSEFPWESAVPQSDARKALRYFFSTGQLFNSIWWEEV